MSEDHISPESTGVVDPLAAKVAGAVTTAAPRHSRTVPDRRTPVPRVNGWYFPELEGPDIADGLVGGEAEFWKSLDEQSISDIWELGLEDEDPLTPTRKLVRTWRAARRRHG